MDGFLSFLMLLVSFISLSGIDLIAAFYGCLYAGCVPVNVRPPHPQNLAATLPTVRMIIDVSVRLCNTEHELNMWNNACSWVWVYVHICLFI